MQAHYILTFDLSSVKMSDWVKGVDLCSKSLECDDAALMSMRNDLQFYSTGSTALRHAAAAVAIFSRP